MSSRGGSLLVLRHVSARHARTCPSSIWAPSSAIIANFPYLRHDNREPYLEPASQLKMTSSLTQKQGTEAAIASDLLSYGGQRFQEPPYLIFRVRARNFYSPAGSWLLMSSLPSPARM